MPMRMFWPAALAAFLLLSSAHAQSPPDAAPEPAIEVQGEASLTAKPDFARVTLGVTTTGKDAGDAMAANARSVSQVIATLKGAGVAPADIQTASLSISPQFANSAQGGAREAIAGYTASNMVTLTARDLGGLGALIDKAVGAGANAIYGVAYGQNDPGALLDKVRPEAVKDARRKAEIYAEAAGAKVGRLLWLTDQGMSAPGPFMRRSYAAAASAAPTPIEAGEDRLTVTVTARFALTQ